MGAPWGTVFWLIRFESRTPQQSQSLSSVKIQNAPRTDRTGWLSIIALLSSVNALATLSSHSTVE
jgi:hypothetical protein